MDKFLKGTGIVIGIFILLTVLMALSTVASFLCSIVLVATALIVLIRPFSPAWVGGRVVGAALLCVAMLGALASAVEGARQHQELRVKNEARLEELCASDPKSYLAELKAAKDPRWLSEFSTIDMAGYEAFIAEQKRLEEETRQGEIARLTDELRTVPASESERLLRLYVRLATLEPANAEYNRKREVLSKEVAAKKEREAEQIARPHRYVSIENFSWSKIGFGSIMEANFTIKNSLPWAVKDIEITCENSAPSGTTIDSNRRTIYERLEANKSKRITKFNMGFIHSEVQRSGCEITKVISLGP